MRKALLEDENIGKIAENPKKMAFLRAIEDRDEEDQVDFLGEGDMLVDSVPDSQTGQDNTTSPEEDAAQAEESELQDHQQTNEPTVAKADTSRMSHRRTTVANSMSRPTTIAEIRESLSYLVEDTVIPDSQRIGSDSEEEDEMKVDQPTQTRRVLGTVRPSVVNRLSIVTCHDDEEKPDGPMAFHAPTSNTASVFKVPLLRRGTNLSTTSSSSSGASTPTTETGVRMGGSKKSNIHYQAREAERRKIVEAAERKRKEEVKKSVIGKGRSSVLGALGRSNGFE
jgi:mediator of replication checkpoint protein 1